MKPPLNIRNLAQWKIACIAIVAICHAILDSNLGIVDGARRLAKLRCEVRSENDLDFRKFAVIHSETDHFPIGNTRKECSPENLKDLDAEKYDLTKLYDFDVVTVFYDRHGEEIGRLFVEDRRLLTHNQIPDLMRKAIVAVEDKRFYVHHGIDYQGTMRALWANIRAGTVRQGGSTITQQLAKHLMGNFEKTFDRKLVEAFLARRIEKDYSKEAILDYYLNRIYFGKGSFGLGSAAKGYFGKSPMELNVAECALLAGIVKSPTNRSPRNDPKKATQCRDCAIKKMREQNLISAREARLAGSTSITLAPLVAVGGSGGVHSYFMGVATRELQEVLGLQDEAAIPQGLRVNTTLDLQMQKDAEVETRKKLKQIEAELASQKMGETHPNHGPLQAAALMLELNSGAIRIVIGGRDYKESPFDRVTMARRENGSLLQPFLYALAFRQLHLHPASMINASFLGSPDSSKPEEVALGDPKKDLTKHFLAIQDALAFANQACATRVGLQLGVKNFVDWLVSAGIEKPTPTVAESLWPLQPLTLMEIASLYQLMGNDGVRRPPYTIESVVNARDEVIYQAGRSGAQALLDPLVAQQMTLTLQAVTREGRASALSNDYAFPAPVVGMTGYSEGYRDSWFAGYTPSVVAAVWVGFDESIPIGNKSIATRCAISLWGNIMQKVLASDTRGAAFPVPASLGKVEVNRRTGAIRGPGFLMPAAGDIFVYLNQHQLGELPHEGQLPSTGAEQPDWSDWLGTMMNSPDTATPLPLLTDEEPNVIPLQAEYRIPGLRGDILTADGKVLATTIQSQNMVLSWPSVEVAQQEEEVMIWVREHLVGASKWLGRVIDIPDSELRSEYRFQRFHPIVVAENLTPAQVLAFPECALAKENFSLQGIPQRAYPQGRLFSHGAGYLKRSQGRNRRQYQAGEVIHDDYAGAYGLEEVLNRELTGKDGHLTIVTTPEGFTKRATVDMEATVGLTVRTTIDSRIQAAAEKSMESIRSGAIVVLNVNTGDVVAMASHPDFDPGSFIPSLPPEQWQALVSAEKNPLLNRAYRDRQPPGSTFKVITSLAAMRAGVFDPDRVIQCPGYFQVGNLTFNFPKETESVSFRKAVANSYNTYFMDLGLRAGRDALISAAREMGVGQPTGIILPDEAPGLMPDPDFVRVTHKRLMGQGDVANASIGQGDVLVTPLQMANWLAAVANEGTLYKPRIVTQLEDRSGKIVTTFPTAILAHIAFPSAPLKKLKDALVAVVEEGTGSSAEVPGIPMAAKTGTAQVGSKKQPRQIAWMGGYLPADHPQYSFAVMIEGDVDQDLHGGTSAGPLVAQIFTKVYSKPAISSNTP